MPTDPQRLARNLIDGFAHARRGTTERIDAGIRRNRQSWGLFVLTDVDGRPLRDVEIRLKQTGHEFRFGCNSFKLGDFDSEDRNRAYERYFSRVFNQAVVPLFWDCLEPTPGELRFDAGSRRIPRRPPVDAIIDWCERNRIEPKGHWLFCDNFMPAWLPRQQDQVMALIERRIVQIAERYGHRILVWDVVNEALSRPRDSISNPSAVLPQDYVYRIFRLAERYLPSSARLYYNDGTGATFQRDLFHYENSALFLLLRDLLGRQVPVGGLGMQFHQYNDVGTWCRGGVSPAKKAWWVDEGLTEFFDPLHQFQVLDQYARLGLPLSISEISLSTVTDLPRADAEQLQADLLYHLYRLWFSHEGVESIVWWNLCDKTAYGDESHWDAGLIGADFAEKPAFQTLDRLVNHDWRTDTVIRTDEHGMAEWCGFHGDYEAILVNGARHRTERLLLSKRSPNEFRIAW